MIQLYKITKTNAQQLGRFYYEKNKVFSPFENEQKDGTYLVQVDLVEYLKENENIKKIDWSSLTKIDLTEIDNKEFII